MVWFCFISLAMITIGARTMPCLLSCDCYQTITGPVSSALRPTALSKHVGKFVDPKTLRIVIKHQDTCFLYG